MQGGNAGRDNQRHEVSDQGCDNVAGTLVQARWYEYYLTASTTSGILFCKPLRFILPYTSTIQLQSGIISKLSTSLPDVIRLLLLASTPTAANIYAQWTLDA